MMERPAGVPTCGGGSRHGPKGGSMTEMGQAQTVADHHMRAALVSSTTKKVLIVVANPSTSTTMGWPVGFWGAELTHPYYGLTQRGIEVTIASPGGGRVDLDSLRARR